MIPKSHLHSAKAFLCWDAFEKLAIQLVPMQKSVAYFFPPKSEYPAIVLFYDSQTKDFSEPLFLLFHEAGHVQQWLQYGSRNQQDLFDQRMNLDHGQEKLAFEKEAWDWGKRLLLVFFTKHELEAEELSESFEQYAERCLKSYAE